MRRSVTTPRRLALIVLAASVVTATLTGGPTRADRADAGTRRAQRALLVPHRPDGRSRHLEQAPNDPAAGDVYAYADNRSSDLVVMNGDTEVARTDIALEGSTDSSVPVAWSDDGRFVTFTDHAKVVIIDVETGGSRQRPCTCYGVAIWNGQVVVAEGDYAPEGNALVSFAVPDLSDRHRLDADLPRGVWWSSLRSGGDALLAFGDNTEEAGAHGALDVYIVQGGGRATQLGDTLVGNSAGASAYAPDTAYGGPRVAYVARASGGACLFLEDVTLVDPTGRRAPLKTDISDMLPDPGSDGAHEFVDLWFGPDGALYGAARSSTCDYSTSTSSVHTPLSVWRLDRSRWVSVDDRPLLSQRELPSGRRLELTASSADLFVREGALDVVDGSKRHPVAQNVAMISAPPPAGDEGAAWLALGDSYSSGEGIEGTLETRSEYQPPRAAEREAGEQRDCRRATGDGMKPTAWAAGAYRQLRDELDLDELTFVACTGAITDEVETQLAEALATAERETWDVVSFSFGGNNIGFGEVIRGCLDHLPKSWKQRIGEGNVGCTVTLDELKRRIDLLVSDGEAVDDPAYVGRWPLPRLFDRATDAVTPGGDVIVAGYPNLIEDTERWGWRRGNLGRVCSGIMKHDVPMLRSAGAYLNERIAEAVAAADEQYRSKDIRFHFVDIANDPYEVDDDPQNRHGRCTDEPWLNGLQPDRENGALRIDRSFHPTQDGHSATAAVVADYVRENVTVATPPGQGEPSDDVAKEVVARRFAPLIRLSKEEEFGPIDADEFIARSTLRWAHDSGCKDHEVASHVEATALGDGQYRHQVAKGRRGRCRHTGREYGSDEKTHPRRHDLVPGTEGFFLDFDNDARTSGGPDAPVYWQHQEEEGSDRRALVYWLFYPHNEFELAGVGVQEHEGDWEQVAVVLDGDLPERMVFWAHGHPCSVPWDEVESLEHRPVAYAAPGSHASYPHEGKQAREDNLDEFTSRGSRWRAWDDLRSLEEQDWWGSAEDDSAGYGGAWGEVGELKDTTGPDGPRRGSAKGAGAFDAEPCP